MRRLLPFILTTVSITSGCDAPAGAIADSNREPAPPAGSRAHPATPSRRERSWLKMEAPDLARPGAIIATGPDGEMLLVWPGGRARSTDDGASWVVERRPAQMSLLFSNRGGSQWVSQAAVTEPGYPHGPLELEPPIVAAGATSTRLYTFARGAYTTIASGFPASDVLGEANARVFLSRGGDVATADGYDGPRVASLDVPSTPILAGAVGGRAVVFTTRDGGATWPAVWQGVGGGALPTAVRMVDPTTGYLLLSDGALYRTSDGLASWQLIGNAPPDVGAVARDLCALSRTRIVVVGAKGRTAVSEDGGRTWDRVLVPGAPALNAVRGDGEKVWAVGDAGAVFESEDGGHSWSDAGIPIGTNLYSLAVREGRAWIVAGDVIYVSP